MTIICDMDDVLINLKDVWVDFLNKKYKLNVDGNNIKQFDMKLSFPDLTPKEIYYPLTTEFIWTQVRPLDGAVKFTKKLIEEGHDFYIATATDYRNIKYKVDQVLKVYFPFFNLDNLICIKDKSLLKGDIRIDDALHNLVNCKDNSLKLLLDNSHNRNLPEEEYRKNRIYRVYTWHQIYNMISDFS